MQCFNVHLKNHSAQKKTDVNKTALISIITKKLILPYGVNLDNYQKKTIFGVSQYAQDENIGVKH
mgnify:CR=1 FL=1